MSGQRAKIDYPTEWTYKVIGREESALKEAISSAVGEREHRISFSRTSSKGRFLSLEVSLMVQSEDERLGLFDAIQAHSGVKMVL